MVDTSAIRPGMAVVGSDGAPMGTVGEVDAAGGAGIIRLAGAGSRAGTPAHVALSSVARVDTQVHLSIPASAALGITALEAQGGPPKRSILPWVIGVLTLLAVIFLVQTCSNARKQEAADPAVQPGTVTAAPGETTGIVAAQTSAGVSGLGAYLAGTDAAPATFTFTQLNFDTGRSSIRAADRAEVAQVAGVLKQYGQARVRIVGYADARGSDPANAQLGQARADAVKAALVAAGIDAGRIETASGGQSNPVDSNATAGGQAENRRTELVVTAR